MKEATKEKKSSENQKETDGGSSLGSPGLLFCRSGVSCRPHSHKTRLERKGGGRRQCFSSGSVSGRHCVSCRRSTGERIVSRQAGSLQVNLSQTGSSSFLRLKLKASSKNLSVCLSARCRSCFLLDSLCSLIIALGS